MAKDLKTVKNEDPMDRSLNGKEMQMERITVKRLENQKKDIELRKELNKNAKARLDVETDNFDVQIKALEENISNSKKLVNGAKIRDVFPVKPVPEVVSNNQKGGITAKTVNVEKAEAPDSKKEDAEEEKVEK